MKNKVLVGLFFLIVCSSCICACGTKNDTNSVSVIEFEDEDEKIEELEKEPDEVYDKTDLEGVKTYHQVIGTELIESEEKYGCYEYMYLINNQYDTNVDEYKKYLTDDYGFTFNPSYSDNSFFSYDYKGNTLSVWFKEQDGKTFLVVRVPISKELKEQNAENIYNTIQPLVDEGLYYKAIDISYYFNEDYKDTLSIRNYCQGVLMQEAGSTSTAMTYLENSNGYLDSEQRIKAIKEEVSACNGTYYYKDDIGLEYYIYVMDGKVSTNLDDEPPRKSSFYLELVKMTLESGNEYWAIGSTSPYFGYGEYDEVKISYSYGFLINDEKMVIVSRHKSSSYNTFNGTYKCISDEVNLADN